MEYINSTCNMSLKKSDFPKICRMCLLFKDDMLILHVPEVLQMIQFCVDIEVRLNDGFPQTICTECFNQMHQYSIFRQQCKHSDEILHKIIINDNENNSLINNVQETIFISLNDSNVKKEFVDCKVGPFDNEVDSIKVEPIDNEFNTKDSISTHGLNKIQGPSESSLLLKKELKDTCENDQSIQEENKSLKREKIKTENNSIPENKFENRMKRRHLEKKHKCDQCTKSFEKPCELAKHLQTTHQRKANLECQICNKKFHLQIQLDLHLKSHSKSNKICNTCGKEFKDRSNLRRHKKIHEKRETIYCVHCGKTYMNEIYLKRHIKRSHNTESSAKRKKVCPICGKVVLNVKIHTIQTHDKHKPFKCNQCNKSFIFNAVLVKHTREKHLGVKKETKALCPVCGKACPTQGDLRKHLMTHDQSRKYNCHLCSKTYKYKLGLQNHLMVHKGIRPYGCPSCTKRFFSKQKLEYHLVIHTGERPFACQICGRRFNHESARQRHLKIHSF